MSEPDLRCGRFRMQRAQRQLLLDGAPVKFDARAFDVLLALVEPAVSSV